MPTRPTSELRAHPLNKRIYSDGADEALIESVRTEGILTPLIVTKGGTVISGHRRLDAARQVGLEKVPVVTSPLTDKTEIEIALITANEQRQRTAEQRIREYAHLKAIEARRASERQVAAGRRGNEGGRGHKKQETLGEDVPRGFSRRSGAIAAKPFKMSYKTLDRGSAVVERIDELDEGGDDDGAQRLRAALNRSIGGAFKLAFPEKATNPKPDPPPDVGEQDGDGAMAPAELPEGAKGWKDIDPIRALWKITRTLVAARSAFAGRGTVKDTELVEAIKAALVPLQAEYRRRTSVDRTEHGIAIIESEFKKGLEPNAAFNEKSLATHVIDVGTACSHLCTYCSSSAQFRRLDTNLVLGIDERNVGVGVVDPRRVERIEKSLTAAKLNSESVVLLCAKVDAWAPEARKYDLGPKLLRLLLDKTPATVRVLTKNAAVVNDLEAFKTYGNRVVVGLSTGIPSPLERVRKIVEPHASPIRARFDALRRSRDLGFRTFGMLCPLLPGVADNAGAVAELFDELVRCDVEEVWAEPVNWYGKGREDTTNALRDACMNDLAEAVEATSTDKGWQDYTLRLVRLIQDRAEQLGMIDRLHVLLYQYRLGPTEQVVRQRPAGLVFLQGNGDDGRAS